jgi:hypothetical protein
MRRNSLLGAAPGAAGGLLGAWMMVQFQRVIAQEVGGSLVDYTFGTVVGAAYGLTVEGVRRVLRGRALNCA